MTTTSSFVPTASAYLAVTGASSSIVLPTTGAPTVALVTNIGSVPVFLALGNSSVTVTAPNGIALMPGASLMLAIGAATNLAADTLAGTTGVNIAVGT